ncbi:MAG: class I SAM-dependent methyltransferase [Nanoarchaeota archaeon]
MKRGDIDRVTGRSKKIQRIINMIPKGLRLRFNPRRYAIERFVEKSSKYLKNGIKILDAGAGPCPYKYFFKHCKYESTDFVDTHKNLDFVSDLSEIPRPDLNYDAILNTEVLEHLENPEKVLSEFNRILKKGGKLILTVPQGWMVHQAPHNYFYFTSYGLKSLLKKAGFSKYKIAPMGGYFWFLADAIRFNNLLEPIKKNKLLYYPLSIIGGLFTQILLPFVFFHLDSLDKKRDWTMGYTVEAIK